MAEDDAADGPRHEPHRVGRERRDGAGEGGKRRKKQLIEDERGSGAVEEEVVPFDGRTDETRGSDLENLRTALQVAGSLDGGGDHDASVDCGGGGRVRPKSWRAGAEVATEPPATPDPFLANRPGRNRSRQRKAWRACERKRSDSEAGPPGREPATAGFGGEPPKSPEDPPTP